MKVLVLKGGNSPERPISLRSAESVVRALKSLGHEVFEYDTKNGFQAIVRYKEKVDVVLPILHGKDGEDGAVQAELESLKLPFLGAGSRVSRLCFDKVAFKKIISELGVLTPKWELVTKETINQSPLLKGPYVLKPVGGGSSIDTVIVRDPENYKLDIEDVFSRHSAMLLEELIKGTEITVPVLGDNALPVIEIIPPKDEEFDYENKYNGTTQELCPPANVSHELQEKARALCEKLHKYLGVRHLSRTDIIINESKLYVLELNTIPGLTDQSLLPKSAQAQGLNMEQLVEEFINMAKDQ